MSDMLSENITVIIINALKELSEEKDINLHNISKNTGIYGPNGSLDSLSLVLLISNIEEKISEEFGKNVTIADERAMSQKNSPFLSVETLSNYINNLLVSTNE